MERANIIQGRRNDEAATLVRREVRSTAKRDLLTKLDTECCSTGYIVHVVALHRQRQCWQGVDMGLLCMLASTKLLAEQGENAEHAHGHAKVWLWKYSLDCWDVRVGLYTGLCKRAQKLAREREQAGGASGGADAQILWQG